MERILVVEDDKEINHLICEFVSGNGYEMLSAENGLDAVRMIRDCNNISLVILDLMLPYQSGDMVLQKVRGFSDIPIIIVSAKSMVQSKIDALRMGADDYITKPFDLDELLVRIEAILRRYKKANTKSENDILSFNSLSIDRNRGTAYINNTELILTSKEFAILELMLLNPLKLFSKSNLFESVWNETYFKDDTTIKVHISNLRNKIRKLDDTREYIETVWGMGYKLNN